RHRRPALLLSLAEVVREREPRGEGRPQHLPADGLGRAAGVALADGEAVQAEGARDDSRPEDPPRGAGARAQAGAGAAGADAVVIAPRTAQTYRKELGELLAE